MPTAANRRAKKTDKPRQRLNRCQHKWERRRADNRTPQKRSWDLNVSTMTIREDDDKDSPVLDDALLHMDYDQYYQHLLTSTRAIRGEVGPISPYAPGNSKLLILWLAKHTRKTLDIDTKTIAKSIWLEAARELPLLPREGVRRSIGFRLRITLRKHGVQWGPLILRIERSKEVPSGAIKNGLLRVLRDGGEPETTVRYISEKMQIVRTKAPSVHAEGRGHRRFAKDYDDKMFYSIPEGERELYKQGKSIEFVHMNFDVPKPDTQSRLMQQVIRSTHLTAEYVNVPHLKKNLRRMMASIVKSRVPQDKEERDEHILNVWDKLPKDETRVLAQGDKDTKAGVLTDKQMLTVWLHTTFFEDGDHIEFVDIEPRGMIFQSYVEHFRHLPEYMWVRYWEKWAASDMYDYVNFREKCFTDGRRVCAKADPQHKCVRRVSASFLPTRSWERLAARGIERVAQEDGPGPASTTKPPVHSQVWSCEEFVTALTRRLENLEFIREFIFVCVSCGKEKAPINASHGDSSAMFDEIQEEEVKQAYDEEATRVAMKTGHDAVSIQRAKPHRSWLSGRRAKRDAASKLRKQIQGVEEIQFRSTKKVLKYSAALAFSRVGRHCFKRKRGVTMGNSLSPAKSGLVYRKKERQFFRSEEAWTKWGADRAKKYQIPLHKMVGQVRIADDDVFFSSLHCECCVAKLGEQVYPPPLRHSGEGAGTTISVIDIVLELRAFSFYISQHNKNGRYLAGGEANPKRTRYPPPIRAPLVTRQVRSGWISGALALTEQRNGDTAHCLFHGLLLMAELLHSGHTPEQLSKACRAIYHHRTAETARYLAQVLKVLTKIPPTERYRTICQIQSTLTAARPCLAMIPGFAV